MNRVKSFNLSIYSIIINVFIILCLTYINIETGKLYEHTHGKSRLWFGVTEYLRFGYKYWLLVPALFALIFSLVDWRKGAGKKAVIAFLLCILTCSLVFIKIWEILASE